MCGESWAICNRNTVHAAEAQPKNSNERFRWPETNPNRKIFTETTPRHIDLRTSGTVGGEGTRSTERRRCAQCSSRIVNVSYKAAKDAKTLQNVIFISNRFYAKPHASH